MLAACVVSGPVTVDVAGRSVVAPARLAADWLVAVATDPVQGVVPGMLDVAGQETVMAGLLSGDVTGVDLQRAACAVIAAVSGRPWWEAVRLVGAVDSSSGELYGHLLLHGVDPGRVTFAGWCAAVYALVTRNMDEKARNQFDFDLKLPPPGEEQEAEGWDTVEW